MQTTEVWVDEELCGLQLGHELRNRRARLMLAQLTRRPGGFVSEVFTEPAARKASYRFVESKEFDWKDLAAPIYEACARRVANERLVIGVVDGSSFAHTDTKGDDGVGPIGSYKAGGSGIKMMSLMVFNLRATPLGIGALELWARPDVPNAIPHAKRDLADKESRHWIDLPTRFLETCESLGVHTKLWLQFDAEGDFNHALLLGCDPRVWLTARVQHDRVLLANSLLADRPMHLCDAIEGAPVCATTSVYLRASSKRKARIATLAVSRVEISTRLRAQWTGRNIADVCVGVVRAREINPPPGATAIEWTLLTTHPIDTARDAIEVLRAYAIRWGIELIHFAAKSGRHRLEESQLESFGALTKWITLSLSAAVHAEAILKRSREEPELPADQIFEREIIDGALTLYQTHRRDAPPQGSTPTLSQMVHIIASIGGYTGKSSGGPPGIETFTRGMADVVVAATVLKVERARPRNA